MAKTIKYYGKKAGWDNKSPLGKDWPCRKFMWVDHLSKDGNGIYYSEPYEYFFGEDHSLDLLRDKWNISFIGESKYNPGHTFVIKFERKVIK